MRTIFRPRFFVISFFILIIAILSFKGSVFAQPTQALNEDWRDTDYGFISRMMDTDHNDNIYIVGDTAVGDYLVIKKFSPTGALLWQTTYNPQPRMRGVWIAVDHDSNPIVLATVISGNNNTPSGWVTLKYDTLGAQQWVSELPGPYADARRVEIDASNNIYVAGRRFLTNGYGNTTHDSVLVKYNPDGSTLWTEVFDNNSAVDEPFALTISLDNSRIGIAGKSGNLFMALMYDPSGNLLWSDAGSQLYPASDVVFGPGNTSYFATGSYFPQDPNPYQMAIAKYDPAGVQAWVNSYSVGDRTIRLGVDAQGNILATGVDVPGYMDWVTIKTDSDGNLLWWQRYDGGRNNDEIPNMLLIDASGAVYVTGKGGPNPSSGNISYLKGIVAKYSSDGTPQWAVFDDYAGGNSIRLGAQDTFASLGFGYLVTTRYTQTGLLDILPEAPTNLSGMVVPDGDNYRVNLYYDDNANNEFWVDIERCEGAGCTDFSIVGQTLGENAEAFSDQAVSSGSTYTYRVRARGFMGQSDPSNVIEIVVAPGAPPAAPGSLVAVMNGSEVELGWQDNSNNESQFYIERCQGAGCTDFSGVAVVGANITAWTDSNAYPGVSYSYRVRAWNSNGFSGYSNVATILIPGNPNSAPVLDPIGDHTVDELTTLTFTATATDPDEPAQTLTFSLAPGAPSGSSIDPISGVFTWTPSENQGPGVYAVTVVVTDDGVPPQSDSETISITVLEVANTIQVYAGEDLSAEEGGMLQFAGAFTETLQLAGSTDSVSIQWDFGDGTTSTGILTPTHNYGDNGIYTVTLVVTNSLGAVGSDSLQVSTSNVAPILDALTDQSVQVGQQFSIPGTFTDPGWLDSHTVMVEWMPGVMESISLPAGVTEFSLEHSYGQVGQHTVSVTIHDQDGAFDSRTFIVIVEPFRMMLPQVRR